ncbi:PREDICTED: uncharacterized protein LOC108367084 isoform X2 [Rhagoletis zephyria]|uniref:uncharacterized protein LOC108367084 isoform X1 n=1 Tax=Rhagoletis zephyria TaxID=28612 RepID=UPI000811333C|nr:PREDICTED: uncharacterized protein LOC108367084 isoform X1 [Rhagoletis zephyria]XP_017477126.1 PREDICTED: uncharacterized protein LOC108367084 isoform X2 [Rhagoletis zephyria]
MCLDFEATRRTTKTKQDLLVYYQNARGLRTKLKDFFTITASWQCDVLCISESWLHPSILDGEIVEQLTISNNHLEQVFVKVKGHGGGDIIIGCVYIPPKSRSDVYSSHIATISYLRNKYPNSSLMIIGDYNLNSSLPQVECESILYEKFLLSGCLQQNNTYNEHGRMLDLCFSDLNLLINKADPIIQEDAYHPALVVQHKFRANLKQNDVPTYVFKKADYAALNSFFLGANWIDLYKLENIDDKLSWFYEIVYSGIAQFVPIFVKKNNEYPCWFSKKLIYKIKQKKIAHQRYKKLKTQANYAVFSSLRSECKELSTSCYESYLGKVENDLKCDPNRFWSFVKNKRRNEITACNGAEISNLFASFFRSVYKEPEGVTHQECDHPDVDMVEFEVCFNDVFRQLTLLNINKGAGPDHIPNIFLRNCAVSQSHISSANRFKQVIFPRRGSYHT